MSEEKADFETKGAVGIAWIENPAKGNALSSKVLGDLIKVLRERLDLFGHLLPQIERLPVPVLAAVRRAAFGGGFELALACGMIIASEKASFCFPEPALGGCPPFGAIRLAELVGGPRAKEIMMPCKRLSASEAESIGLVNRVVADEELMSSAISLAEDIGKKDPIAIQMIKVSMNRG